MPLLYKHLDFQKRPLYWAPLLQTAARKLCKNFMSAVVAKNTVGLPFDLLRAKPALPIFRNELETRTHEQPKKISIPAIMTSSAKTLEFAERAG